ncbi:phosphatase PAP2 family protein [Actinotalea sp. M2MS4P-6]|uniref:phosphatase PAP2 family protein n=1 Tax=Actinotalea sp. M2MS4P-6 TaxID=2983762 RepID=UPI0021E4DF20|nr:phosphatase PAP2 family protein [Actinotalea sp. M2MS4P-6]MCV2394922.1 phosphatase PAP2 family protein [Actinotalea sp. M2MS4P-6]
MTAETAAPPAESPPGHRLPAFAVAVLAGLSVFVVHLLFVTSVSGRQVDGAALEGAEYGRGRLWQVAEPVLSVISVPFVIVVVLVAMLMAVLRRRIALAVQVAVLVVGSNVTTQVLKNYLVRPDLGLDDRIANSLPSGHTTVAASAAAALVLAVPRRYRALAATVGAVYTAATGISTLIGGWHRPSDVVAALGVVMAWAGLVLAFGPRGTGFGRAGHVRGVASMLVGVGIVVGGLSAVAYMRVAAADTIGDTELLVAYAGGALGIVAVCSVAFGILVGIVAAADPAD